MLHFYAVVLPMFDDKMVSINPLTMETLDEKAAPHTTNSLHKIFAPFTLENNLYLVQHKKLQSNISVIT